MWEIRITGPKIDVGMNGIDLDDVPKALIDAYLTFLEHFITMCAFCWRELYVKDGNARAMPRAAGIASIPWIRLTATVATVVSDRDASCSGTISPCGSWYSP
jgi:hypothetical protein